MSKKLYAAFVPLLATLAFAAMPATSQAAFHWFPCKNEGASHNYTDSECLLKNGGNFEKKVIANGEEHKIQVVAFGKLTFTASNGITFTCKVLAGGNIWNLAGGGLDNIEAFYNYECASEVCIPITTEAKNLVWPTKLVEVAGKPADEIGSAAKEIEILVNCGATPATFHGILTPTLSNPTEVHPLQAVFTATTGTLADGPVTAKVEGTLNIVGFKLAETIFVE